MKTAALILGWSALCLALPMHADEKKLSPERLDELDKHGFFSPAFKAAVHDLVDRNHELDETKADEVKLKASLPDLQSQNDDEKAKVAALQKESDYYDHLQDSDFDAFQALMKADKSTPSQQIAAAQAYLWAYPTSPHSGEVQQAMQGVQKKVGDQQQADKDAEAARMAEQDRLIKGAQAKTLSLADWRAFLKDKSQLEVVKYMGLPTSKGGDYWNYAGEWTVDPSTQQKAGLQITFNGGRVLGIAPITQ